MMAPFDSEPGVAVDSSTDQWSGYPVARDRLLDAVAERAPGRTVVLTGDIHSNWVNDLRAGFDRPDRPVVATEFVGTSISSSGDGAEAWESVETNAGENPHLRWHNARRGYVRCDIEPEGWTTTYRTVPYVTRPGAPVRTASTWRLEKGRPGVSRG
jgi:alkaline phosphatase D